MYMLMKEGKQLSAMSIMVGEVKIQKLRNNPIQRQQIMIECKKCHAQTRKGSQCESPAMKNGRCRMHGGMSTGAPKGNQNARKHGYYSAEMQNRRQEMWKMIKNAKALASELL